MTESIGHEEGTRGTETSKYPEEEKSIEMSSVAASERDRGQTREHALWGCGLTNVREILAEERWKAQPKRVTAP